MKNVHECSSRLVCIQILSLSETEDALWMCPDCYTYGIMFEIGDPRRAMAVEWPMRILKAIYADEMPDLPRVPIGGSH